MRLWLQFPAADHERRFGSYNVLLQLEDWRFKDTFTSVRNEQ